MLQVAFDVGPLAWVFKDVSFACRYVTVMIDSPWVADKMHPKKVCFFLFFQSFYFLWLFFLAYVALVTPTLDKIVVSIFIHFADRSTTSTNDPSFFLGLTGNDTAANFARQAMPCHTRCYFKTSFSLSSGTNIELAYT